MKKKKSRRSVSRSRSQKRPDPSKVAPSPYWTLERGVSYSLLSRFINCRERFRLRYVEGLKDRGKPQESMDFGTYFHELLELHAKFPRLSASAICRKAKKPLPRLLKLQANILFERYLWWFSETKYDYRAAEVEFNFNYRLPNGRTVRLVGKTDEVINSPNRDGTIWVQENKTASDINEYKLETSVPHAIQPLMYSIAMEDKYKKRVSGVVYNVIRKPGLKPSKTKMNAEELAKYQKSNPKSKATMRSETEKEYLRRLRDDITERPEFYFYRWEIVITEEHMDRWRKMTFDPILTQLCLWWDSVKHDPFSPWTTPDPTIVDWEGLSPNLQKQNMVPNPHHHMRPFGVYDPMTNGSGDYFDLITRNRRLSVDGGHEPFPELEHVD